MISCTRKISFDAGHRVVGHGGKCKDLHGHRYTIEATFETEILDDLGMVIDFGDIKEILGTWIDKNWDHTMILSRDDKELGENIARITNQQIYYIDSNPTAENIALYLINKICPQIFANTKLKCKKIKLHETPNCFVQVYA